MMNLNTQKIIQILEQISAKLSAPDGNGAWSYYKNQADVRADIKDHLERLEKHDFSRFKELELLFAPTGSLQETAISSGWENRFLVLATQFDEAVSGKI